MAKSEESACNAGYPGLMSGLGPWRRKWQPTSVFLPGEFMDRGAWQVIVPGGGKKLGMTEQEKHK